MNRKLIVLELNELTPSLMDRFIELGHLPNFKTLKDRSLCFISDAQENPPALEPWIQWVSIHTGLPFAEHAVFNLGQGENFKAPRIWDRVAENGGRCFVLASMNAHFNSKYKDQIALIPDPWALNLTPNPIDKYKAFFNFIRSYVQEYTNKSTPLHTRDYINFFTFMAASGLSGETIKKTFVQLISEKTGSPKWQRAAILDRLLWDVFRHEWRKTQPDYASLFLNSTAHLQHYYWRDFEPEKFSLKSDQTTGASNAILFGYKSMDKIVGECLAMIDKNTSVALVTALGQQPMSKYDDQGGKLVFKIRNVDNLLCFAGYRGPYQYKPVMAEQFHLVFENREEAERAFERIDCLEIGSEKLMDLRVEGHTIFGGCALIQEPIKETAISSKFTNEQLPFSALFYPVDCIKSGMHHPDGIFWLSGPGIKQRIEGGRIPITEIQEYLLNAIGMRGDDQRDQLIQ